MEHLFELAGKVGKVLEKQNATVTTAESCTGGGIAYCLTEIAGSSAWFERTFVTYCNEAKQQMVGVDGQTLLQSGAVSEAVVAEMAKGALEQAGATYSVAVSGIAGPGGGSGEKPVGMVCFGWADETGRCITETCLFEGNRGAVRESSIAHALNRLLELAKAKTLSDSTKDQKSSTQV